MRNFAGPVVLVEPHQHRGVGVAGHVVGEERHLPVDEELAQDDVPHRHRQRAVGAGRSGQPLVGELDVVGVVGAHRDDLLAAVARLGHPVRVRGAGHRQVRPPHDQVARVPPVGGLRHVGLVTEHVRGRDRQVGVPVVEAQHGRPDQRQEPGPRGVRHHAHRRDRREAEHPVGAVLLDRVDVCRSDHLDRLVPGRAHQAAPAPGADVALPAVRVTDDVGPRQHRIAEPLPSLPVQLEQHAPDVGVADAGRRVGVPGERGAAGAPARLVFGPVRARPTGSRSAALPR